MGWLTNKIAPELLVWPRTPFSLRARPARDSNAWRTNPSTK